MVDHSQSESLWWMSARIKVCYVHDVVHDFCSVINSGDSFHASDFLHHRLIIHTGRGQLQKRKCFNLFNSNKCKHLKSLKVSCYPDDSRNICLTKHLRLVRVLQLDDIILEEIGFLFHLRFLKLRTHDVSAIPLSWLNLRNLETLLITEHYDSIVLLPRLFQLSKLKHVRIDESSFFDEEEEDNIQSRILEGENSKLTTLSYVDISYFSRHE